MTNRNFEISELPMNVRAKNERKSPDSFAGIAGSAKSRGASNEEAAETPRRGELQDRIAEELRRALMRGQFFPGQKLSLRGLAEQLGTSAMPVREVLSQLTAAGVLEALPNRTVQVPRMTEPKFKELTQVRALLEGYAAELACVNCTPALIKSLQKIDADLTKFSKERNVLGILTSNQAFHFGIYAASQSEILLPLIEALWLRAGPVMYFSLSEQAHIWDAGTHQDILDCMRAGDATGTRRAIERDIHRTSKLLITKSAIFNTGLASVAKLPQVQRDKRSTV
ncbi:GntR family transcriptional regulator [Variovorax saccharolyticus]|uniref:GntR family transcriptional regulator n=1 Tax=Variovorax saccharolyticus TaxID=3053516 RepID=UPI00257558E3|nr:GntR family transcriptional regulator [Variovorax sp. J31P216]MDM0029936.1 GntR family transcriptional regulator [Variovorax sp. J31P216]